MHKNSLTKKTHAWVFISIMKVVSAKNYADCRLQTSYKKFLHKTLLSFLQLALNDRHGNTIHLEIVSL